MNPNHYIIGRVPTGAGDKLFFGKVEHRSGKILEGYHEKNAHIQGLKSSFEIPEKDVVLDLGANPHHGSVYGFDVTNRFFLRKVHDYFGPICFMYKPDKEVARKLFVALDTAAKILQRAGFNYPSTTAVWEITSKDAKGKWAGSFRKSKKPDSIPHKFNIKPESMPDSEWVYVILHEFAHYLHMTALVDQPKVNAAWIKVFNTSIKLQTVRKETAVSLLNALTAGEERPSDFRTGLDEDERNAFNWIVRTIKTDHAVSIKELDTLFEADTKDEIAAVWPQRTLHKKDLAPLVSEYATVSFYELFAESFAFHFTKRKLPAAITKLMERSLSIAKAQQEKQE